MTSTSIQLNRIIAEVTNRAKPYGIYSLFLDFDGTLVPIAANPATPQLDSATRETLRRIASSPWCVTTIISGRSINDLRPRIGLDSPIYAGNHGHEIKGRGLHFEEPGAAGLRERLQRLTWSLVAALQPVPGVYVEYKGLTTSIHYRQVSPAEFERVEAAVLGEVARNEDDFRINKGKKVFEIVPRSGWHKGAAALWINQHLGLDEKLSIYLGDDTTDEDAFETLTEAITVEVGGSGLGCAGFQLPDPEAVQEFLGWMADFVERPESSAKLAGRNGH
jgi:trehalose-phosphatase